MLPGEGKVSGRRPVKTSASTIRPSTAGNGPMSPPRMRSRYSRAAPLTVVARWSPEKSEPAGAGLGVLSITSLICVPSGSGRLGGGGT